MNFAQKWINIFIRYTIDGLPVTTTLGVQRVFGNSTGVNLRPEGGGGKSFKKPKQLLFPKSIHFLTTEILLPLIYL